MPGGGAIFLFLLGLGLLVTAIVLTQLGSERRMRARVAGAAGEVVGAEQARDAAAASPSIRMQTGSQRPWLDRTYRFFRFNPEVRQAYTFPIILVIIIGVLVGIGAFFRFRNVLGIPIALLLALTSGSFLVRGIFGWQLNKYKEALFQQIPDAMGLVVRAIRAGLPMSEALRSISREMPSPTKDEFAKIVGDVAIGRPVDEAIMRLHDRTQLTEIAFLAVTLGLQSQTGGSLAETLDNLADMVRKRVQAAKRAKALAAEGRMQAGILVVLPFVAALAMSFIQPGYWATYTENPSGIRMALVGLGLMALGVLVIRWLIIQAGRD